MQQEVMVLGEGLEPSRLLPLDFESSVFTSFTTRATERKE